MFWVEAAERSPFHCCVTGSNDGPLIDTGNTLHGYDHRVYIGAKGVDRVARFAGWTPPDERALLDERISELEAKVQQLEEEVAEADRFRDATEYTLSKFDTRVRNKPGRKPKARPDLEEAA